MWSWHGGPGSVLVIAATALLVAASLTATASPVGMEGFGTRVGPSDSDFVPTLEPLRYASICRADHPPDGTIEGDRFYLDPDSGFVGSPDHAEILLTATPRGPPGTLVEEASRQQNASCRDAPLGMSIAWVDADHDGNWSRGDTFYLGHDAGRDFELDASAPGGDWWIRLQSTAGKAAGTPVLPGDADLDRFAEDAAVNTSVNLTSDGGIYIHDADRDGALGSGDSAYLSPETLPVGAAPKPSTVVLVHEFYVFGTMPEHDNAPVELHEPTGPTICRRPQGASGNLSDDAFYLKLDADRTLEPHDLRLTASHGSSAGTLLGDEASNRTHPRPECNPASYAWIDVDGDGEKDAGDPVFVGWDADPNLAVEPSSPDGEWWIEVDRFEGAVVTDDRTLRAHGTGFRDFRPLQPGHQPAGFMYADEDDSGRFGENDQAYLAIGNASEGASPELGDVRLYGYFVRGWGEDHDGVPYASDDCPRTPGLYGGCPADHGPMEAGEPGEETDEEMDSPTAGPEEAPQPDSAGSGSEEPSSGANRTSNPGNRVAATPLVSFLSISIASVILLHARRS